MYCNGTIIGQTTEGYDVFCEWDRHCKELIYTAAEYDTAGDMCQVYGLHLLKDGSLVYQAGAPCQVSGRGCRTWYADEYREGYDIMPRRMPSLERYPVSHGPFQTEGEAQEWAEGNLS